MNAYERVREKHWSQERVELLFKFSQFQQRSHSITEVAQELAWPFRDIPQLSLGLCTLTPASMDERSP